MRITIEYFSKIYDGFHELVFGFVKSARCLITFGGCQGHFTNQPRSCHRCISDCSGYVSSMVFCPEYKTVF